MIELKKIDKRIVIGMLILLAGAVWILMHSRSQSPAPEGTADLVGSQFQQYPYPNSDGSPISIPPVEIGDSPLSLSYNFAPPGSNVYNTLPQIVPSVTGGAGCKCEDDCGGGVQPLFKPIEVSSDFMDAQTDNLGSVPQFAE